MVIYTYFIQQLHLRLHEMQTKMPQFHMHVWIDLSLEKPQSEETKDGKAIDKGSKQQYVNTYQNMEKREPQLNIKSLKLF